MDAEIIFDAEIDKTETPWTVRINRPAIREADILFGTAYRMGGLWHFTESKKGMPDSWYTPTIS